MAALSLMGRRNKRRRRELSKWAIFKKTYLAFQSNIYFTLAVTLCYYTVKSRKQTIVKFPSIVRECFIFKKTVFLHKLSK